MKNTPRFSKAEELANAISHGVGLALAIAATFALVWTAASNGNNREILSTLAFGVTLILLYFSSTMNHSLAAGKTKDFFHNFDQVAIYLLIAGTYTPLALSVVGGNLGWVMFTVEWGLAFSGLLTKAFLPNKFERGVNVFTIVSYVIMGWLLLAFIVPLKQNLPGTSFILIFTGGFFYTFGILFFKLEKLKFSHLIWHIMVIAGSACHWSAIFLFVLNKN